MVASGFRVAKLAVVALSIAACSKKENNAGTDTTAAAGAMTDTSAMAASTSSAWSDENIVALLDEANAADSTAGSIAATKGTNSAVRDFGKRMMRDHHQLRAQGQALAKKLKITPAAPADDPLAADVQKYTETLNTTAKGKDFDKAYIDGEVDVHKKVLDLATKAASQTQNTELKNLIQKAAPMIQAHLDLAESIQKRLQ